MFDEKQRLTHISQPCAGEQKKVESNESAIHWLEREREKASQREKEKENDKETERERYRKICREGGT